MDNPLTVYKASAGSGKTFRLALEYIKLLVLAPEGGEFAHIYFIDWDCVRARRRQLNITVMGTTEDVEDRKYNGGEVIDTLPKYMEDTKQYQPEFDLQLKDRK